jgi:hypothetical protein
MKNRNLLKFVLLTSVILAGIYLVSCETKQEPSAEAGNVSKAFEKFFKAVKSKNTEEIKKTMSKSTIKFAEGIAGQRKLPVEKILENGFHRSTMTDDLPPMRDERVKDKYGAVEVFSKKDNRWEDIRFVFEDGEWKLAVGETWSGAFKSPGDSRTIRERKNANAAGNSDLVPYNKGNVNLNAKPKIITPKEMKQKK